jgi:hypothetical protein
MKSRIPCSHREREYESLLGGSDCVEAFYHL